MQQRFIDYFRCPQELAVFRLQGNLGTQKGFFRFGPNAICYGRLSSGRTAGTETGYLEDVLASARIEDHSCYLPFDSAEVVDNLRLERYSPSAQSKGRQSLASRIVRNMYYAVRPLLPVSVRKHLQRRSLRGWDQRAFPHWPVDQTVDKIFEQMMILALRANQVDRIPFIWFWPDGCSGCATMTHDVETAAGRDFCPNLMDLNDTYGIKSSFQLVPEERYTVPDELLQLIRERGFEVNVHDLNHDGNLFLDHDEFLRRAAKINGYVRKFGALGYRSGVLYRNLDWYDAFDFSYDMSVPNVGHLDPQPGGCCTTKPFFVGRILEIPVTATQDYTLFHILQQYSTDLWEQQIQLILENHGSANFIVHPDYVMEERARKTYAALLSHLAHLRRDANLWIALPRELNDWWRARSQMKLVERNGRWEIEGPEKHRARIAFARLADGRLGYDAQAGSH
jgi:hypothetical protein